MTTFDTPSLFEVGADAPAAPVGVAPASGTHRRSDPPTSVAAAESMDEQTLHVELRRVLAVIDDAGTYGATAGEVTAALRADGFTRERGSIARRITDLRQHGHVRDSGRVRRLDRRGARDEIVWVAR